MNEAKESNTFEDASPFLAVISSDFLSFFRGFLNEFNANITFKLSIGHLSKHSMLCEMLFLPVVQIFDISNAIYASLRFQQVRILRKESSVDDTTTMIRFLEMRVCKAKEHLLDRSFSEILNDMSIFIFTIQQISSQQATIQVSDKFKSNETSTTTTTSKQFTTIPKQIYSLSSLFLK